MVLIIHPGTQWSSHSLKTLRKKKNKHESPLGVCTFSRVFTAPCLKLGRTFHVFGDGGQKQSSAPPDDITVGNVGYGIYAKCGTFGKVIVFSVEP